MPYKDKICPNCGDTFTPRAPSQKFCRKEIDSSCPECGVDVQNVCTYHKHMRTFCSSTCASKSELTEQKRSQTVQEKFGVTNVMELAEFKTKVQETQKAKNDGKLAFNTQKQKETMMERYGGPSPMASEEIRKKVEQTQKKNHDGVFAFNNEKQKETMMERYGSHGILGNTEKYKEHETQMLKTYGVKKISSDPEWSKKILQTIIERHGALFGNKTISKINLKFAELLKTKGYEVSFEKKIGKYFFDLYIKEYKLLIDINPTVTHNSTLSFACLRDKCEQPCTQHQPKDPNYHYHRALLAKRDNYNLIQIYDWDDPEKIFSKIEAVARKSKLQSLRASQLTVQEISQKEANKFLNENHSQKGSKQQLHCYGLFTKENTLVSVMTFSKPRFNAKYEYELNRFATKTGIQVYGGATKIFNHFLKTVNPKNVISYMDLNHTTKQITYLNHLNFKEAEPTGPSLIWSKLRSPQIVKQTSLNKIGADRLLKTNYGETYSNQEIMELEGYVKIYTAGNRVYIWEKK